MAASGGKIVLAAANMGDVAGRYRGSFIDGAPISLFMQRRDERLFSDFSYRAR